MVVKRIWLCLFAAAATCVSACAMPADEASWRGVARPAAERWVVDFPVSARDIGIIEAEDSWQRTGSIEADLESSIHDFASQWNPAGWRLSKRIPIAENEGKVGSILLLWERRDRCIMLMIKQHDRRHCKFYARELAKSALSDEEMNRETVKSGD